MSDTILGVIIGGLIGAIASFASTALTLRHSRKLANADREHADRAAARARSHERWADPYVETIELVERWANLAHSTLFNAIETFDPLPDWAGDDRLRLLQAKMDAYASDAVRHFLKGWFDARQKLLGAMGAVGIAKQAGQGTSKEYADLHRVEGELNDATAKVIDAIRADLADRPPPPPPTTPEVGTGAPLTQGPPLASRPERAALPRRLALIVIVTAVVVVAAVLAVALMRSDHAVTLRATVAVTHFSDDGSFHCHTDESIYISEANKSTIITTRRLNRRGTVSGPSLGECQVPVRVPNVDAHAVYNVWTDEDNGTGARPSHYWSLRRDQMDQNHHLIRRES